MDERSIYMDAKEIYQAVLDDCTTQINRIKDEYGEVLAAKICDKLSQQYSTRMDNLEQQNRELSLRLKKVEAEFKSRRTESTENGSKTAHGINGQSIREKITRRVGTFSKPLCAFEFNGWYYYAKEEMGNCLFRSDGTYEEQLTNYSVESLMFYHARVENGKLYFRDANYRERSIDI